MMTTTKKEVKATPGGWTGTAGFHETFLAPFEEEEVQALRVLAAMLVGENLAQVKPSSDPKVTRRQWEAVGQDLRYLEAYLEELAGYLHETIGPDKEAWEMIGALAKVREEAVGALARKFEPYAVLDYRELEATTRSEGPGGWEGDGGFYETSLAPLPEEQAAALRRVASMLFGYNLEFRKASVGEGENREPYRQWRAVGRDLRYLERYLAWFMDSVEELRPNVAEYMKDLAGKLGALATQFESEVEAARR
jgi:hypothetical protein